MESSFYSGELQAFETAQLCIMYCILCDSLQHRGGALCSGLLHPLRTAQCSCTLTQKSERNASTQSKNRKSAVKQAKKDEEDEEEDKKYF